MAYNVLYFKGILLFLSCSLCILLHDFLCEFRLAACTEDCFEEYQPFNSPEHGDIVNATVFDIHLSLCNAIRSLHGAW